MEVPPTPESNIPIGELFMFVKILKIEKIYFLFFLENSGETQKCGKIKKPPKRRFFYRIYKFLLFNT